MDRINDEKIKIVNKAKIKPPDPPPVNSSENSLKMEDLDTSV
jgi:hypothetical protein